MFTLRAKGRVGSSPGESGWGGVGEHLRGRNEVLSWRGWLSGWERGGDLRRLSLGGGQVLFWKEDNEAWSDPPNVYFVRVRGSLPCGDGREEGLRESLGCEEDGDFNYNGQGRGGHFQVPI